MFSFEFSYQVGTKICRIDAKKSLTLTNEAYCLGNDFINFSTNKLK